MKTKSRAIHKTTYPHIVKTEGVNGGAATIEGTRIAVWHVVGYYYELGMSVEAIVMDWDSSRLRKYLAHWLTIMTTRQK
jgi:uncharacterized protein (DUF433 family)